MILITRNITAGVASLFAAAVNLLRPAT